MLMLGFIQNVISIVFIILAIFSMAVLFAEIFLQSYFAEVALQSLRTHNPTRMINTRVVAINTTLQTATQIQQEYYHWSPRIVRIANAVPAQVTLDRIAFARSEGLLELAGSVPSREVLLALKQSLESLDEITEVPIPLSDLTKQDQIAYTLSIPFAF